MFSQASPSVQPTLIAGYARHPRALARNPRVQAALSEQLSGQNCFFGVGPEPVLCCLTQRTAAWLGRRIKANPPQGSLSIFKVPPDPPAGLSYHPQRSGSVPLL